MGVDDKDFAREALGGPFRCRGFVGEPAREHGAREHDGEDEAPSLAHARHRRS
jgi:hypothetical protein